MISHYILGKHTQYMIKGISIGYLKKNPSIYSTGQSNNPWITFIFHI